MERPLFSLLAPVYKVEPFLPKCIESMVNQTYKNIEIILIDDGSPDKCPYICDYYQDIDNRVRVIHKENGGLVSARQAGIREATGEYIVYVDGDDWIDKRFCEKIAIEIERYRPDIICCGLVKVYSDVMESCCLEYRKGFYSRKNICEEIFPKLIQDKNGQHFDLSLCAKAIRRELILPAQLSVDQRINIGEDISCMALCVFRSSAMVIIEDCLYYYRQNLSSMTKCKSAYSWDGPEIRGRHLEFHIGSKDDDMIEQISRGVVHSLFTVVRSQFNKKGLSKKEIKKEIIKQLERPYYKQAIHTSKFTGLRANMMMCSLKYKVLWPIDLLNTIENFKSSRKMIR